MAGKRSNPMEVATSCVSFVLLLLILSASGVNAEFRGTRQVFNITCDPQKREFQSHCRSETLETIAAKIKEKLM